MVIVFSTKPSILAGGVVAGPLEKRSIFSSYFDDVVDDERWQQQTNEKGHMQMIKQACDLMKKNINL